MRKSFGKIFGLLILNFVLVLSCGKMNDDSSQLSSLQPLAHESNLFIRISQSQLNKKFVQDFGFNRDSKYDDEYAFGYMKRENFEKLPSEIVEDIVVLNEKLLKHHKFDAKTLKIVPSQYKLEGENFYAGYHNYEQLKTKLEEVSRQNPSLVKLETAGKSVNGRELFYVKISDNASIDENEPNLLYIANMHGDETTGREMLIYLLDELVNGYKANNQRIKNIVDNAQVFLMPSMNPDGFENDTRENASDVDLNRDFPDFTSDPNDTSTGRAVETAAVMTLHQKYLFHAALNFHGGAVVFNLPWDTKANDTPQNKFGDDKAMYTMGREYADLNPSMLQGGFDKGLTYGYEWYEVDGGMQDWASYYRNSMESTVELSDDKWPPASALESYWKENKEPLIRYLERGIRGIHLEIVDQTGNPVKNPVITHSTTRRAITFSSNQVHRVTVAGKQSVTVKAQGYETMTFDIDAAEFRGQFKKVVMK